LATRVCSAATFAVALRQRCDGSVRVRRSGPRRRETRRWARQLTYKAAEAGARLVVADRWFPSSRQCSACGAVRAKLTLAEREFHCEDQSCGTRLDRDLNAAINLAALAHRVVLGELRPDAKPPAGNPRKTTTGGTGYRHGKTPGPAGSQRHPREAVTR
jgi:putative transposase